MFSERRCFELSQMAFALALIVVSGVIVLASLGLLGIFIDK